MRMMQRILAFCLAVLMLTMPALAEESAPAEATAAPQTESVDNADEVPELIQQVLDIAHNEWETLAGKRLDKSNKYTWWRCGKGCKFGWCGGFVTWCMLEAGVPMDELKHVPDSVTGVYHVKEASVGKLLKGYEKLGRTTNIPRPGYPVVYAVRKSANKTIHVGLVYQVEDRGNGIYRLTTIEGNVSNRVKMYIYDYDSSEDAIGSNMTPVPEDERTLEPNVYTSYKLHDKAWYINTFLMSWE